MTVLTAPLPPPLSLGRPDDWARSAAVAVLGSRWPAGDESATWDVADRWYALAEALSGPRVTAFAAAEQIVAGLVGAGIASDGFREAWERLSADDDAPLNALVQIAAELGQLVEECGREIEAAKLAAWLEVGTVLTELAGLSVAIELTLGAARPVADGLIAAGRVAVEQIFDRLVERLGGNVGDPGGNVGGRVPVGNFDGQVPVGNFDGRESGGREAGLATRRLTLADLPTPSGDVGIATRRLAPPPPVPKSASASADDRERSSDRDLFGPTRRIDPGELRSGPSAFRPWPDAFGRPAIPPPRTAGSHGRTFEQVQREEYADFLSTVADGIRANLATARPGTEVGADRRRQEYADQVEAEAGADRRGREYADQVEAEAALVRSRPGSEPMAAAPKWALSDRARAAEVHPPGGLRPVDPVPLKALTDAVPQAGDGRPDRLPDPRLGRWFSLLNAGGPSSDPTRGLNCLDAVLALFETYQRARPRVAGARAFDGYAHGSPDRPVGGEWSGVRRIQRATRSEFQNLCPFVGGAEPGPARAAIDAALRNLANHLHNSGPGAFAFILTDFESGGCHAWAAVNQGGALLFLDPQLARMSIEEPLYRHYGYPTGANVVSIDALVVDGRGEPTPLPYHGAGQWTAQALAEGAY